MAVEGLLGPKFDVVLDCSRCAAAWVLCKGLEVAVSVSELGEVAFDFRFLLSKEACPERVADL